MKNKEIPSFIFAITFFLISIIRFVTQEITSGFLLLVASVGFLLNYLYIKKAQDKNEDL
ncbi:MAG: hypothetical protein ACOCRO_06185 [Halanaerobiales bacterium]